MRPAATIQDTLERQLEHPETKEPSMAISTGSTNVLICGQPAVRARVDRVPWPCEPAGLPIASGSASITVEGLPLVGHREQVANKVAIRAPLLRTVWINNEKVPALPCMCEKPEDLELSAKEKKLLERDGDELRKMLREGDESAYGLLGAFLQEHDRDGGFDSAKDIKTAAMGKWNQTKVSLSGDDEFLVNRQGVVENRRNAGDAIFSDAYASHGIGDMKTESMLKTFDNHSETLGKIDQLAKIDSDTSPENKAIILSAYVTTTEGAIALGECYMQDAAAAAEAAGIDLSMFPPETRAGFFNDCWRQGYEQVVHKWKLALLEGRMPMLGEGCATCYRMQLILDELNEGVAPELQIAFPAD